MAYSTYYEKENAVAEVLGAEVRSVLGEIVSDYSAPEKYRPYFMEAASAFSRLNDYLELNVSGKFRELSLGEMEAWNSSLFGELLEENYGSSWCNPEKAVKDFGEAGKYLSMIYYDAVSKVAVAANGKAFMLYAYETVLTGLYRKLCEADMSVDELRQYASDARRRNSIEAIRVQTLEMYDDDWDYYTDIINKADLSDLRYLYFAGKFVSENEVKTAQFLNSLSQAEVESMAKTFSDGYLTGYAKLNKDIRSKYSVALYYTLGFERMLREVVRNFNSIGVKCVTYAGYCHSSEANRQASYDHRNDIAVCLDSDFIAAYLDSMNKAMESLGRKSTGYAGPMALETFGEKEFNPLNKVECIDFSDEQQPLMVELQAKSRKITTSYVNPEERSFSIIAYPVPEIGEKFEEIFAETVKVNTLDYRTYEDIQQKLIDALDQADYVTVKGKGENKTDLTVKIKNLENPEKETAFENCVADVNIPVGEVFTSPVLKGTNGLLNVTKVYLNGMMVKGLELVLKDGMIDSITCSNFETPEENKKYLDDIIMFHRDTLPIGEFAIGTNTTAYKMGIEYDIQDKLPILIAEKTGPHFAMGDTCYSRSEEVKAFNPDGKEIVAKDNEVSILRKTEESKAYFNCHTDITIPYNELDTIIVHRKDGSTIDLIQNGRFVLPGTEELNVPLDQMSC